MRTGSRRPPRTQRPARVRRPRGSQCPPCLLGGPRPARIQEAPSLLLLSLRSGIWNRADAAPTCPGRCPLPWIYSQAAPLREQHPPPNVDSPLRCGPLSQPSAPAAAGPAPWSRTGAGRPSCVRRGAPEPRVRRAAAPRAFDPTPRAEGRAGQAHLASATAGAARRVRPGGLGVAARGRSHRDPECAELGAAWPWPWPGPGGTRCGSTVGDF